MQTTKTFLPWILSLPVLEQNWSTDFRSFFDVIFQHFHQIFTLFYKFFNPNLEFYIRFQRLRIPWGSSIGPWQSKLVWQSLLQRFVKTRPYAWLKTSPAVCSKSFFFFTKKCFWLQNVSKSHQNRLFFCQFVFFFCYFRQCGLLEWSCWKSAYGIPHLALGWG